ncbi:MFS transporter [Streptomyces nitrosporeus]|uniref:MFS transporter n=1 Tax=Streptomyces nitrosporeus TaxID=28894 RepID=UPI00167E134F|nr:MFS transporter [Streptomyces nitrosporeus]GGZ20014.1 MFS transporter [Streptomyces nitrosporeus]
MTTKKDSRASGRLAAMFASLRRSRGFRTYFVAQAVSNVGTWMQITGLSWVVLDLTGSPSKLGIVLAIETVPILLLGPFAGTLADRYDIRKLALTTQTLLACIIASFAVLQMTSRLGYPAILALSFLFGITYAVDSPARQSLLPELVDAQDLNNAVAMNTVSLNGSSLFGPALGGFMVSGIGASWCFLLNAASFACVALALATVNSGTRQHEHKDTEAFGAKGIAETFRLVAGIPELRAALVMMALVGTLTYEFPVTLPLLAREGFEAGPALYGLFFAAAGAGATVWGLRLAGQKDQDKASVPRASMMLGAVVLIAAWTPHPVIAVAVFILVGACSVRFMGLANAAVLRTAHAQFRGRIMSLWQICFQGSTLLGAPLIGFVAAHTGARWALALGGAAALAAGLLGRFATSHPTDARHAEPAAQTLEAAHE